MKLLYVITELDEGGAENALCQVASAMCRRGHDVLVVAIFNGDGAVGERLRSAGVRTMSVELSSATQFFRLLRLRRIINDFGPDLIHSWLFHANFLTRLVKRQHIPLLASLRVVEPRRSHQLADRMTRHHVRRYLCVSESVAAFARESVGVDAERVQVIENGVDVAFFDEARAVARDYGTLRGLCVARIAEQKGLDILLAALAQLPDEIAWDWTFVGAQPEPEYLASLQAQALRTGIAERLTWAGPVPRAELLSVYGAANLLALPSRWEGQPNVALEAMAAGVPVLLSPDAGWAAGRAPVDVLPQNDGDTWASAISKFAAQAPAEIEQQVAKAGDWVKARSWDAVAEQYEAVYNETVSVS